MLKPVARILPLLIALAGLFSIPGDTSATYIQPSIFFRTVHQNVAMNTNMHWIVAPLSYLSTATLVENRCDGLGHITTPYAGIAKNLRFAMNCCISNGGQIVVEVGVSTGGCPGVSAVSTTLTCTVTSAVQSGCGCSDLTNTEAIPEGATLSYEITGSSSPNPGCGGFNISFDYERR